jgi:hypothetical protein
MNDQTKEIMALVRSEMDKSFEKQLWSTSDNKVFSPEEYTKALQEVNSKYPFEPAIIVCDETNNASEDAAKGVIHVTVELPPFLKEIALEKLGLTDED